MVGSESEFCVRVERHVYHRIVVSMSLYCKIPTKRIDLDEDTENHCSCINSKFIYQPCGHIVTGNVNVVHDKEAKHVLQKRPKIPPPSKIT